jgi:hypothetical protein
VVEITCPDNECLIEPVDEVHEAEVEFISGDAQTPPAGDPIDISATAEDVEDETTEVVAAKTTGTVEGRVATEVLL